MRVGFGVFLGLAFVLATAVIKPAWSGQVGEDCSFKGIKLQGKVKIVEHFPDLKVQIVENFPDLKVKKVDHFPDACGKWQLVENFPDFKVQFVENFPDIKVKFVENFPGL